jgi:hypothetical protein
VERALLHGSSGLNFNGRQLWVVGFAGLEVQAQEAVLDVDRRFEGNGRVGSATLDNDIIVGKLDFFYVNVEYALPHGLMINLCTSNGDCGSETSYVKLPTLRQSTRIRTGKMQRDGVVTSGNWDLVVEDTPSLSLVQDLFGCFRNGDPFVKVWVALVVVLVLAPHAAFGIGQGRVASTTNANGGKGRWHGRDWGGRGRCDGCGNGRGIAQSVHGNAGNGCGILAGNVFHFHRQEAVHDIDRHLLVARLVSLAGELDHVNIGNQLSFNYHVEDPLVFLLEINFGQQDDDLVLARWNGNVVVELTPTVEQKKRLNGQGL